MPKSEHFIDGTATIGGEVEAAYWAKLEIFQINVPSAARPHAVERLLQAKRARQTVHFAGQYVADIPSSLLIRVLTEALSDQPTGDGNEGTMFEHYVTLIFEQLDNDPNVTKDLIARLEWSYLRLLEYSNRALRERCQRFWRCHRIFSCKYCQRPIEVKNEKRCLDENAEDYEVQRSMAGQAWTLLHGWSHVPGPSEDGKTIDGAELEDWVRKARTSLVKKADRAAIGDQIIGSSACPRARR